MIFRVYFYIIIDSRMKLFGMMNNIIHSRDLSLVFSIFFFFLNGFIITADKKQISRFVQTIISK